MRILVSGASQTVRRLSSHPNLGCLLTPDAGNTVRSMIALGLPWAADNAAFSGFSAIRFESMVILKIYRSWAAHGGPGPLWVTAPDVVADHRATAALFPFWERRIHTFDLPVAFVAQDGATPANVPWGHLEAVFVGGSTDWKTGPEARAVVDAARGRGKLVHMGRVNTKQRMAVAHRWGVDTVDGTAFSMYPDTKLPTALAWVAEMESA